MEPGDGRLGVTGGGKHGQNILELARKVRSDGRKLESEHRWGVKVPASSKEEKARSRSPPVL